MIVQVYTVTTTNVVVFGEKVISRKLMETLLLFQKVDAEDYLLKISYTKTFQKRLVKYPLIFFIFVVYV